MCFKICRAKNVILKNDKKKSRFPQSYIWKFEYAKVERDSNFFFLIWEIASKTDNFFVLNLFWKCTPPVISFQTHTHLFFVYLFILPNYEYCKRVLYFRHRRQATSGGLQLHPPVPGGGARRIRIRPPLPPRRGLGKRAPQAAQLPAAGAGRRQNVRRQQRPLFTHPLGRRRDGVWVHAPDRRLCLRRHGVDVQEKEATGRLHSPNQRALQANHERGNASNNKSATIFLAIAKCKFSCSISGSEGTSSTRTTRTGYRSTGWKCCQVTRSRWTSTRAASCSVWTRSTGSCGRRPRTRSCRILSGRCRRSGCARPSTRRWSAFRCWQSKCMRTRLWDVITNIFGLLEK